MNKRSLGALLALNVALLAAYLVVSIIQPRTAEAQVTDRAGEYLMVAGDVRGQKPEVLYVIEQRTRAMSGLIYRSTNDRWEPFQEGRNVGNDVQRLGGGN